MIKVLRALGSVVVGFVLAFALVIAVELFSAVVHPFPADFSGTPEEMCRHVERYPAWVLAVAAAAWVGTTFVSTWVATRLGGRIAGIILGLFLIWAVGFNVSMLPYPLWFKVSTVVGIPVACLIGIRLPTAALLRARAQADAGSTGSPDGQPDNRTTGQPMSRANMRKGQALPKMAQPVKYTRVHAFA